MIRLPPWLLSGVTGATPLLLAALGETVRERAGAINIGVEGEMLAGAFAAFAAGRATHSATLACAAAAVAGLLFAEAFAAFAFSAGADQIVTGTAVNLLALGLTGFLSRTFYPLAAGSGAPLPACFAGLTLVDAVAFLLVPAVWIFLYRTTWGLRLRATGESIADSRSLGGPVRRIRAGANLLAGALSGIAGAVLVLEISDTFVEGMTAGRGFVAIALVAFGRWNPVGIALAALFFGLLQAAQFQLQARGLVTRPPQALLMLPYVFSLLALAGFTGKSRSPADLGKPG